MKIHKILFSALFFFILGNAIAQEMSTKAKSNIESTETGRIDILLNSKNFEFIANTVYPSGGPSKNLVGSEYSITFTPEMIVSNMPFYGRAHSTIAMAQDTGMRFKGIPEKLVIEKNLKGYEILSKVQDENDNFSISMSVSESGYATLTIKSNNRGTISYYGEVVEIKQ